jgi:flagellar biosynthetic protein FliP
VSLLRRLAVGTGAVLAAGAFLLAGAGAASASTLTTGTMSASSPQPIATITPIKPIAPIAPTSTAGTSTGTSSGSVVVGPSGPSSPAGPGGGITVGVNGVNGKPSSSIVIILAITLLSVAPALLLMCTAFTKIIVVLSLTRNALGLTSVPPNQVLAGLALFLSLFVMGPVLSQVNTDGIQPYLNGKLTQSQAFDAGVKPLRGFMLDHTRKEELALMTKAAKLPMPKDRADVPLTTLVPAFVLSELKSAFIIGFVIFIPFLVIDIVVSSSLMSMGMMMLPPVVISLPFKLLLFVLIDGWGLVVTSLISSYN